LVEDESNLLFNSTQENEVQNHVPRWRAKSAANRHTANLASPSGIWKVNRTTEKSNPYMEPQLQKPVFLPPAMW
jgi:hypothetical protein